MATAFSVTGPKEFAALWSCLGHWRVSFFFIVQIFASDKIWSPIPFTKVKINPIPLLCDFLGICSCIVPFSYWFQL